jgi:TetR/AcrR family transcriptional regulator
MMVIMTLERKEKEKVQRRTAIIDAAQVLFFSKPHEEITIEAIAEKAQLAKGTVYLYFKNKEEVYNAVALRGARILSALFQEKTKKEKNGIEKTFATGEAYYEFYKGYPQYFRMLMDAENRLAVCQEHVNMQELGKLANENFLIVQNSVEEGIRDGSIKPDLDPLLTAVFLIQSTRSMIQLPPGFDMFLREAGVDKDATLKFTLQALRKFLQNTKDKKTVA